MLLVVVLVIISVLALLGASFAYRMNADLASVQALQDQQQARFAAEAGITRAIMLLREGRWDMSNWYNNYQAFRRIPVYLPDARSEGEGKGGSESIADQEKVEGRPAYRFSLVAYEPSENQTERAKIRYGLTDEASKVNLNTATRSQLLALFDSVRHDNVTSEELADALIDWRDADDETSPRGAESGYYLTLHPAYRAKNAPLSSVEELLMIKGFNGRILYGEDYNRNGYLDDNENDGEQEGSAFPPDDGDGQLNQGLLPYVTVYSWDWNRSNDNKARVDINTVKFDQVASGMGDGGDGMPSGGGMRGAGGGAGGGGMGGAGMPAGGGPGGPGSAAGGDNAAGGLGGLQSFLTRVPAHITDEIRPEVIDFIAQAQKRGYKFKSIGDLLGLEIYDNGRSNHDRMWSDYARKFRQAERRMDDEQQQNGEGAEAEEEEEDEEEFGRESGGMRNRGGRGDAGRDDESTDRPRGDFRGREQESMDSGRNDRPRGDFRDRGGRSGNNSDEEEDEGGGTDPRRTNPSNRPGFGNSRGDQSPVFRLVSTDDFKGHIRLMQSIRDDAGGTNPEPDPGQGTGGDRPSRGGRGGSRGPGGVDRGGRDNSADSGDSSGQPERPGRGGRRGWPGADRDQEGGEGNEPGAGTDRQRGRGGRGGRGRGQENDGEDPDGEEDGEGGGGSSNPPLVSPVELSDMAVLCDRLCVWDSPVMAGLINVNTASAAVLRTIPGLDEEDVASIVGKRKSLEGPDKLTPAWLVTSGAITPEKFALISNLVTTRSIQFTIDSIGFADHVGSVKRIQAVVEMRGQMAQFKYYRDITSLGIGYPVWDDQRSEGFAFSDR